MILWNAIATLAKLSATGLLVVSYVPQILQLHKTKSAEGVSLSFWFILDTSLLMLFIMAVDGYINTGSIGLALAQGVNLLLAIIVTVQVLVYKKRG